MIKDFEKVKNTPDSYIVPRDYLMDLIKNSIKLRHLENARVEWGYYDEAISGNDDE